MPALEKDTRPEHRFSPHGHRCGGGTAARGGPPRRWPGPTKGSGRSAVVRRNSRAGSFRATSRRGCSAAPAGGTRGSHTPKSPFPPASALRRTWSCSCVLGAALLSVGFRLQVPCREKETVRDLCKAFISNQKHRLPDSDAIRTPHEISLFDYICIIIATHRGPTASAAQRCLTEGANLHSQRPVGRSGLGWFSPIMSREAHPPSRPHPRRLPPRHRRRTRQAPPGRRREETTENAI